MQVGQKGIEKKISLRTSTKWTDARWLHGYNIFVLRTFLTCVFVFFCNVELTIMSCFKFLVRDYFLFLIFRMLLTVSFLKIKYVFVKNLFLL